MAWFDKDKDKEENSKNLRRVNRSVICQSQLSTGYIVGRDGI
jgi:hypothetical protein